MTPLEFSRRWGAGLVPASGEAVRELAVPEEAKRFLVEAGLPAEAEPSLTFALAEPRFPYVSALGLPDLDPAGPFARCRVIGKRVDWPLCIDEAQEGRIVYIDVDGAGLWVNSGVAALAESLLAFRAFADPVKAREAEDLARLAESIAARRAGTGSVGVTTLPSPEAAAQARASEDEEMRARLVTLRDALRAADAAAMANRAGFWPVALEGLAQINGIPWER